MINDQVCILASFFNTKDGIARVISEIAWYFEDNAIIFTPEYNSDCTYKIPQKTKVFEIKTGFNNKVLKFLFCSIASIWKITIYINRTREISVVNPHGIHPIILASIVKLLSFNRKLKNSAFIYDKEEIISSLNNNLINKFRRKLYVFSIKVFLKIGALNEILVLDNPMAQLLRKTLNTNKVKIIRIGVCHSLLELSKREILLPSEKIKKIVGKETRIKLFFNGILIPRRRLEDLLAACSLLIKNNQIDVILYIGGSLQYNKQYVDFIFKKVDNLQLSNHVNFLDGLLEEELAYMYKGCDIFIFPPDEQTWGLAPLEAMLFAKPVIVSTGCGVSEVLDKNMAVLVPPKEPVLLANAIKVLVDNKNMQETIGRNAQNYVLRKLTFASTVDELKRLWFGN
jgi:glycosyltransferase involved in cell wall biosynthesis